MTDDHLRVSDSEREAVAERLRRAAGDGRLDPDELEERLERAYAARTRADLAPLTADLPAPEPPAAPGGAPIGAASPSRPTAGDQALPPGRWTARELRDRAAGFLVPNLICVGVWLASGANGDFWPRWVLLVTTIGLLASFVRGPDAERERQRRRRRADNSR